jgi:hypothetical protein
VSPTFNQIGGLSRKNITTPGKLDSVKHQVGSNSNF